MRLNFILNYKWYFGIVLLVAVIISVQHYLYVPPLNSIDFKYKYTHYNDYLLFRQSFFHLIQHKDLYIGYPYEYYDLYKYTPTFSILMAPLAYLPNLPGLILWNALNALVLFYAFRKFPFSTDKKLLFAVGFIFIEATTALIISESNCLMAGLLILAFLSFENKKLFLASFLLILATFIKPYGLALIPIFLFYPSKWKTLGYLAFWSAVLLLLPLIAVSPNELIGIYHGWGMLLKNDHDVSYGISVMGWLYTWFGIDGKYYTLAVGLLLFMLPLLRYKSFEYKTFRQLFLAFALVWVTIFNHKAESPGFIIAIAGVAIWFSQSYSKFNLALIILCFLFTIMSPADLYPEYIRNHFFKPYTIKAVPCIIIWVKMLYELMTTDFSAKEITLREKSAAPGSLLA
ncbi:MAG TPA: glycosyltransferase family 87 protein [Bacteroidia bacterium]|jgi:hypothetical protein|nr:glycosyltransferase family 87 protein [Bacteroidia bacterium]